MKIARQVVLGAAIALAAFGQASAQDWPTRSVTVVVPIPAGVASDIIARVVFEQVGKQVGQTFVIENRPGAGGTIGANMVAKAAPDGHTILVYGAIAAANALYARLPYDTVADFTPVVPFGETPLVVVTAVGRYNTLAELIAAAKAKPGELNYSTVGIGSAAHFGAVRLAVSAGITAQHIPFKGPEWLADTIAGRVDFSVPPVTTVIGPIRDGKLKALAVGAAKRAASLPDVPTLSVPPSGDATRHRRQAARRGRKRTGIAVGAGAVGEDRCREAADDRCGIRPVLQERRRRQSRAREGGQHSEAIGAMPAIDR
jgi:tripartite-type tricarboxylate transporter receptor subunit TctC